MCPEARELGWDTPVMHQSLATDCPPSMVQKLPGSGGQPWTGEGHNCELLEANTLELGDRCLAQLGDPGRTPTDLPPPHLQGHHGKPQSCPCCLSGLHETQAVLGVAALPATLHSHCL